MGMGNLAEKRAEGTHEFQPESLSPCCMGTSHERGGKGAEQLHNWALSVGFFFGYLWGFLIPYVFQVSGLKPSRN